MGNRLLIMGLCVFCGTTLAALKHSEFDVSGGQQWFDTGIDLLPGARVAIGATGSLDYGTGQAVTPDGLSRGWKDLLRTLPLNGSGRGALIGRIGSTDASFPFAIGSKKEIRANLAGRLFLGVNQMESETAEGSFHVTVDILDAGRAGAGVAPDTSAPVRGITAELMARVPRRVADQDGDPGDMVNFLIVGTEENMKQAFSAAGWVLVDRTKKDAVLHGLIATLSKQSYVELPMSELYLFGRPQDFGFAHAEPFAVAASRHHLRVWKAPFTVHGQVLWIGAATHDVGFEKDQRNGAVTHKIDAAVDDERKFVGDSFAATGLATQMSYFVPADPVKEARTATGGSWHSDGRVLVIVLGQ